MSLNLKSGRTYIDDSLVEHPTAYFAVEKAIFETGKITFLCNIWKNEATFLASLSDSTIKPIKNGVGAVVDGANFMTYFMSPDENGIVPIGYMNDVFYKFLTAERPQISGIEYDDWEEDLTLGVPATKPGSLRPTEIKGMH